MLSGVLLLQYKHASLLQPHTAMSYEQMCHAYPTASDTWPRGHAPCEKKGLRPNSAIQVYSRSTASRRTNAQSTHMAEGAQTDNVVAATAR